MPEWEDCLCRTCIAEQGIECNFYVFCPECGNKRCPKATNHLHACTQSNDAGQYGSYYGETCLKECCS